MNKRMKLCLYVCLVLGGCEAEQPALDSDEPALDGDEPALDSDEPALGSDESVTGATEQALALPRDHHVTRAYGGNIISYGFTYVTEEFLPGGPCSVGYVRPPVPRVRWYGTGGFCQFDGWASADIHDCRIRIIGGTGGGGFGGECQSWVDETPEVVPNPTTSSGFFSFTATNTNNALMNTTKRTITANAGQLVTVGTCGMAGSTFSLDTYLRVFNQAAVEVASNDDACDGRGSLLFFTAPITGPIEIHAGCWSSGSCSGTVAWTVQ